MLTIPYAYCMENLLNVVLLVATQFWNKKANTAKSCDHAPKYSLSLSLGLYLEVKYPVLLPSVLYIFICYCSWFGDIRERPFVTLT